MNNKKPTKVCIVERHGGCVSKLTPRFEHHGGGTGEACGVYWGLLYHTGFNTINRKISPLKGSQVTANTRQTPISAAGCPHQKFDVTITTAYQGGIGEILLYADFQLPFAPYDGLLLVVGNIDFLVSQPCFDVKMQYFPLTPKDLTDEDIKEYFGLRFESIEQAIEIFQEAGFYVLEYTPTGGTRITLDAS